MDAKQSAKNRAKLLKLKQKLTDGMHVQNRDLKKWLGDAAYKDMENEWQSQQSLRSELKDTPAQVSEYKNRLQKVTLLYSRAESKSHKKHHSAAKNLYDQSENLAEDLIEYLHEILQTDQSLQIWFDRLPDENNHGLTPASLPQVINSRSRYNQGGGFASAIVSKQQVKICAIDKCLDALDPVDTSDSDRLALQAHFRAILKKQE